MRRSLAALWLIALVSNIAAEEFELPALRGSSPYVPAPPVYTRWGGFYVGGNFGVTPATMNFGNGPSTVVAKILRFTELESKFTPDQWPMIPHAFAHGTSFGGFVGYNSQWDDVVLAVEASYTHLPVTGSGSDSISRIVTLSDFNYAVTVASAASMHLYEFATMRVRSGYAMGQFLPYLTAGFAVGRVDYSKTASVSYPAPTYALAPPTPPDQPPPTPPPFFQATSESKKNALAFGYALGGGVDVAVLPNLFLRGEYEFVGLPISHMQITLHNFRAGAGLKF